MKRLNTKLQLFSLFTTMLVLLFLSCNNTQTNNKDNNDTKDSLKADTIKLPSKESVKIFSSDSLEIIADIYITEKNKLPIILLFHQAGYSRGEYIETAPKLNKLGFTCIAIDQRSGNEINGIVNESFKKAKAKNLPTEYTDAKTDLDAALNYAKQNFPNKKVILWGSSYSASLVFILATENPEITSAVMAFSPGEYFKYSDKTIAEYAKNVTCPVFVTSAKNEHKDWNDIFEAIPKGNKTSFLPETKGKHGSQALWEVNSGSKEYWKAVNEFLKQFKK